MDCSRFAEALTAHAAGDELTAEARSHVASCAGCREELARQRELIGRIDSELADALRVTPSPQLLPQVRAQVAATPMAPRWLPALRFAAAAASLAVVVGVVTLLMFRGLSVVPPVAPPVPIVPPAVVAGPAPLDEGRQSANAPLARPVVRRATRAAGTPAAPRPEEPEVLVPADRRIAVEQLIRIASRGGLDEKVFPAPAKNGGTTVTSELPRAIDIPSITVRNLTVSTIVIGSATERRPD